MKNFFAIVLSVALCGPASATECFFKNERHFETADEPGETVEESSQSASVCKVNGCFLISIEDDENTDDFEASLYFCPGKNINVSLKRGYSDEETSAGVFLGSCDTIIIKNSSNDKSFVHRFC